MYIYIYYIIYVYIILYIYILYIYIYYPIINYSTYFCISSTVRFGQGHGKSDAGKRPHLLRIRGSLGRSGRNGVRVGLPRWFSMVFNIAVDQNIEKKTIASLENWSAINWLDTISMHHRSKNSMGKHVMGCLTTHNLWYYVERHEFNDVVSCMRNYTMSHDGTHVSWHSAMPQKPII